MTAEGVRKLLDRAVGSGESKPASKPVAVVLLVIVAVAAAGYLLFSYLARRKEALARHESDVLANDVRQQREVLDKLAEGAKEREVVEDGIKEIEVLKKDKDRQIEELVVGRKEFEKKLAVVTSWEDVA
jgi:hypothetical protein